MKWTRHSQGGWLRNSLTRCVGVNQWNNDADWLLSVFIKVSLVREKKEEAGEFFGIECNDTTFTNQTARFGDMQKRKGNKALIYPRDWIRQHVEFGKLTYKLVLAVYLILCPMQCRHIWVLSVEITIVFTWQSSDSVRNSFNFIFSNCNNLPFRAYHFMLCDCCVLEMFMLHVVNIFSALTWPGRAVVLSTTRARKPPGPGCASCVWQTRKT